MKSKLKVHLRTSPPTQCKNLRTFLLPRALKIVKITDFVILKFATNNDTKNPGDSKIPKFSQRDHNGKMTGLVIQGACPNIYIFSGKPKMSTV